MKAAQINAYGHADAIQIVEIDPPTLLEGQVLIEVSASSINPFDTKLREGMMKDSIPVKFPITLGGDVAGIVREVGTGVTNVSVGERVYGQANAIAGASGAFAEQAAAKASQIAKAPDSISLVEAAALPLVGVSALQALTEHLNLQSGQRLFIHGASGGIGTIAIQIAKNIGAIVTASYKDQGEDILKNLGADEIINTEATPLNEIENRSFDAIYDLVGGDDFAALFPALKPGGLAVSMVASGYEAAAKENGITALTQGTKVTSEKLDHLRQLVDDGIISPQVTQVFAFDDIQEAFRQRESGKATGKVVLQIQAENAEA